MQWKLLWSISLNFSTPFLFLTGLMIGFVSFQWSVSSCMILAFSWEETSNTIYLTNREEKELQAITIAEVKAISLNCAYCFLLFTHSFWGLLYFEFAHHWQIIKSLCFILAKLYHFLYDLICIEMILILHYFVMFSNKSIGILFFAIQITIAIISASLVHIIRWVHL